VPESFDDHIKLMFDMQVLAFRAKITRVATMMYARDTSGAVYPQSGVRDGFHVASHHSNNRANMDKFALINKYHVQMLAYFLEKLQATPDGDGNLLDHSGPLRQQHEQRQSARSRSVAHHAGGRRFRPTQRRAAHAVSEHTPMSNLLLTMLDKLGVQSCS
jgi:hypothetical protein